ncbi:MAG: hypothetical protein LBT00_12905 [Spirochaetaceae bacterium]|nr:hypothetical protein [Spirochaetaceae bacterium]
MRTSGNIVAAGEAIQTGSLLDCFGLRPRNDGRQSPRTGLSLRDGGNMVAVSGEAIQTRWSSAGLLRSARNDEGLARQ